MSSYLRFSPVFFVFLKGKKIGHRGGGGVPTPPHPLNPPLFKYIKNRFSDIKKYRINSTTAPHIFTYKLSKYFFFKSPRVTSTGGYLLQPILLFSSSLRNPQFTSWRRSLNAQKPTETEPVYSSIWLLFFLHFVTERTKRICLMPVSFLSFSLL